MDLKEFVGEALRQIVEGVAEAQERVEDAGAYINPADDEARERSGEHLGGARYASVHGKGIIPWEIRMVEFDVAVTVNESTDRKGGLGVVAAVVTLGGTATSAESTQSITRVKFSVPVAFPHHPGTNPQENLRKGKPKSLPPTT